MKTWGHIALAGTLFFLPQFVAANITNISNDPFWAQGPFRAKCAEPNPANTIHSFYEANHHYTPQDGPCLFSIPQTLSGDKVIGLYRGRVGSSTFITGEVSRQGGTIEQTLVQADFISFHDIPEDEDFFFVIYNLDISPSDIFHDYLTGATTTLPEGAVENQTFYTLPWKWGEKPPSEYDPVVIIPGILGSWEKNGEWVIDPILHTYDNLIDTFLANSYVENETLFSFPYDWRTSNEVTASILKNKIEDIKEVCDCDHVDLIGHSMGGLVGLQYILLDGYENDVDQLFLVATPVMGAPKAYKTWEGGILDFGEDVANIIMQAIFRNEARQAGYGIGSGSIFDYIHGWPIVSIQELLPVNNNYLSTATGTLEYPTGYPGNLFLQNLHSKFLDTEIYNKVEIQMVQADTNGTETVDGFVVEPSTELPKWEHGKPISEKLGAGDGTVPRWSTENFIGPSVTFDNTNHNVIASSSAGWIFDQLNRRNPETIIGKIYNVIYDADYVALIQNIVSTSDDFRILMETLKNLFSFETSPRDILAFVIFSPVDMQVVAPDGKRIGKNLNTNEVVNEIPDAIYSGLNTEHEFVIIFDPLPGEYKLETIGTGEGEYTIAAGHVDRTDISEAILEGSTAEGQIITHIATVSSTTTKVTLTKDIILPPPLEEEITPDTCIADMNIAYKNKWITKKSIYTRLVADCKLLETLFKTREIIEKVVPTKRDKLQKLLLSMTNKAIANTLNLMDKLAKDKSVKKEAKDLITKNTQWFRDHEL